MDRTGLPHTSLARTLSALVDKGIVSWRMPYSTRASKGRRYVMTDPYLRFYLRFLTTAADTIERGQRSFTRADASALIEQRRSVPGADAGTALLGVSRRGFEPNTGIDVTLEPTDLIDAYRA